MAKPVSLPAAAIEAFSSAASEPLELNKDDLRFFKGFVKSKGQYSAPPPVARYLRLIRRFRVLKAPGGAKIVVAVDLSQLPADWASWKEPGPYGYPYVLRLMKDMVEELLKSLAIPKTSDFLGSGFFAFFAKSTAAKGALPLEKLHQSFIADGSLFLGTVPKAWAVYEPMTVQNFEKALAEHR